MGNRVSCAPSIASSRRIRVLCSTDGRVEEYARPLKAAELMLENPGHFLCDSINLKVAHRVCGLAADEDLEPRRFYYLLPMDMLYSVLSGAEFGSLTRMASKAMKNGSSKHIGKIFPLFGEFCMFPTDAKLAAKGANVKLHRRPMVRLSRQPSWQPALATILETPSGL